MFALKKILKAFRDIILSVPSMDAYKRERNTDAIKRNTFQKAGRNSACLSELNLPFRLFYFYLFYLIF